MSDNLPQTCNPARDQELSPPEGVCASDYHVIEDAVMDTARGRWFLREYARRIRSAETSQILQMLGSIEQSIAERKSAAQPDDISQPSASVPRLASGASVEDLKSVHEKLLDIVWHMRERGFDGQTCTSIRHEAGKLLGIIAKSEAPQEDDALAATPLPAPEAETRGDGPDTAGSQRLEPADDMVEKTALVEDRSSSASPIDAYEPSAPVEDPAGQADNEKDRSFGFDHSQQLRDSMARLEIAAGQTIIDTHVSQPPAVIEEDAGAVAIRSQSTSGLAFSSDDTNEALSQGIIDPEKCGVAGFAYIDGLSLRDRLALFS